MVFVHERIQRCTPINEEFDNFQGVGLSVNRIMHKLAYSDIPTTAEKKINR
jgi:hypothetical protein